jgi:hypothetical protein
LPYATCAVRLARSRSLTETALRSSCAPALPRPPQPAPTFVTMANAPLGGDRMATVLVLICPTAKAEYFSAKAHCLVGQISASALPLSPCGRGWLREAKTGEGFSPRRQPPHPPSLSRGHLLPQGEKEGALTLSAARAAARFPETAAAPRSARRAPSAPDSARRTAPDAPRR